jgi:hypothetical protein
MKEYKPIKLIPKSSTYMEWVETTSNALGVPFDPNDPKHYENSKRSPILELLGLNEEKSGNGKIPSEMKESRSSNRNK